MIFCSWVIRGLRPCAGGRVAVPARGENRAPPPAPLRKPTPLVRLSSSYYIFVPPQINKYYVFDLVPDKSVIQFALKGGLPTFAISWKNPTLEESHFGLDTYVRALEEAVDVMREISGSEDVNIW